MPSYLTSKNGHKLAYHYSPGTDPSLPGVIFMGGFKSDMEGSKATYLEEQCKKRGQSYVRFDYSGHGQSDIDFVDGCIGDWAKDAIEILDKVTAPNQKYILVGSSMGGWMMMLTAKARPNRVAGLIGIAAAPDFTEKLMWTGLSPEKQEMLMQNGRVEEPNDYSDEPYIITKKLIEDGRKHLLLDEHFETHYPVHLIHGKLDTDVPPSWPDLIKKSMGRDDIKITYIDDGGHTLSRDKDLPIINDAILSMSKGE